MLEILKSTIYLGVQITDNLMWTLNTSSITKKGQTPLLLPTETEEEPSLAAVSQPGIGIAPLLTKWFLQVNYVVVCMAEKIIYISLLPVQEIFKTCCICKATSIVDDPTHTLFCILTSGKRLHSFRTLTTSMAIRLLNKNLRIIY